MRYTIHKGGQKCVQGGEVAIRTSTSNSTLSRRWRIWGNDVNEKQIQDKVPVFWIDAALNGDKVLSF